VLFDNVDTAKIHVERVKSSRAKWNLGYCCYDVASILETLKVFKGVPAIVE